MIEKLLAYFDFRKMDGIVRQIPNQKLNSFSDMLSDLLQGNVSDGLHNIERAFVSFLFPGLYECKGFMEQVLLLALLAMLLRYLALLVKSKQLVDLAFYLVYFLLMLLIMNTFDDMFSTGMHVVKLLKEFMIALIPTYCLSISIANGVTSASGNYQMMLWLLSGVCYILENLLMPLAKSYMFLGLMNGLDEKGRMKGFMKLLSKGLNLGVRLCLTTAISVSALENMMATQVDGMQKTVVQKMVSAIPGIGDLSDSVTQVFLHATRLIQNGIGVTAIMIMILCCMEPLVKLFCFTFVMKLASALMDFLGLNQMAQTLASTGESGAQVLKISLCVVLMFVIVIAVTLLILGRGA